jgi:pimeloyl-ACP methyl ester carboxylesterase
MARRALTIGPTTLSITEKGDGAPIVFLHAFPLDARMWTPQLEALPAGWHGVAPDLRGFGSSPRTANPARHVSDHAADVIGLVEAIGNGPAVLVGLSMGGYVAFEIMCRAPERVVKLALLDTTARPDLPEQTEQRKLQIEMARDGRFDAIARLLFPRFVAAAHQGDRTLQRIVRTMADDTGAEAFVRQQTAIMNRVDSRPSLAALGCPTLVVVGEQDTLTPPDRAAEIAAGITGAREVIVPDCGHLSTLEQPEALTRLLVDFLRS